MSGPAWAAAPAATTTAEDPVVKFARLAQPFLQALAAPATDLRKGAYSARDHEAVIASLASLLHGLLLEPVKTDLPEIASALSAANAQEAPCWQAFSAAPAAGEAAKAAAVKLRDALAAVATAFSGTGGKGRLDARGTDLDAQRGKFGDALKSGDARGLDQLLSGLYSERGGVDDGGVPSGGVAGAGGSTSRTPDPRVGSALKRRGLDDASVPTFGPGEKGDEPAPSLESLRARQAGLSALSAAYQATPWPGASPVRGPLAQVERQIALIDTTQAGADWVKAHADALKKAGADPDKLLADRERGDERHGRLSAARACFPFEKKVGKLLDSDDMGRRDAAARKALSSPDPAVRVISIADLREMQGADPEYFGARGLWAQYVTFTLANIGVFPNGTSLSPEESSACRPARG